MKRKNLNLTNEKLADISDMDLSKISLLQNGKHGCNGYSLYKILYSFNINIFDNNIMLNSRQLDKNIEYLKESLKFLQGLKKTDDK
ncbi:MAG TPA: hypothetical protein VLL98_04910 [Rickettsiales bacterium]|nr:hypothetical protein [Rickettsiales bacterium]